MNQELKILICSDIDYPNLVAEIYCDGKFVALVTNENSSTKIIFPEHEDEEKIARKVDFYWFLNALREAEIKLNQSV